MAYNCTGVLSGPGCTFDLSYVRQKCIESLGHPGRQDQGAIFVCISSVLTPYESAILASRQYILTLWPAFIGFICTLGPDPAEMVLDSIWWAFLFSFTCGGLAGLDSKRPRHHMTVRSEKRGHEICENQSAEIDPARPETIPRSHGRPTRTVSALVRMEWLGYIICVALYAAFNYLFGWALQQAIVPALPYYSWLAAGVWYWISASPHLVILAVEAIQNRVDLYELQDDLATVKERTPLQRRTTGYLSLPDEHATELVERNAGQIHAKLVERSQIYYKVQSRNCFYIWFRILVLQWQRKFYRVLVRPESNHWFFLGMKAFVAMGRITLFALGSVIMGNILLMPIPTDLYLFVLLLFTTGIPRVIFYGVWRSKARGADLVVVCDEYVMEADE